MTPFDRATAVTADGPGHWAGGLDASYGVMGKLNGGYLIAIVARAAAADLALQHPGRADARLVQATARYLAAPTAGPASVETVLLGASRRVATLRATLRSAGTATIEAMLTFASGDLGDADRWSREAPPEIPAPSDCVRVLPRPDSAQYIPLHGVVDLRMDPSTAGFREGAPTHRGEIRASFALPETDRLDQYGLLLAADVMPPAIFDLGHRGWTPTLTLDVHLLDAPAPGPVLIRQRVTGVTGGLLSQSCDVWDADDRLVAHATQLAVLPKG